MKQSRLRKWLWKINPIRRYKHQWTIRQLIARVESLENKVPRYDDIHTLRDELRRLDANIEEVRDMLGRLTARGRFVPFTDIGAR